MNKRIPWHWVFMVFTTLAYLHYPGINNDIAFSIIPGWNVVSNPLYPLLQLVNKINIYIFIWLILSIVIYFFLYKKRVLLPKYIVLSHITISTAIAFMAINFAWIYNMYFGNNMVLEQTMRFIFYVKTAGIIFILSQLIWLGFAFYRFINSNKDTASEIFEVERGEF